MGLSIWASPYTSHTGPIWACYLGPTWVFHGSVHMVLSVWDTYGSFMGLSKWVCLYELAIWAPYGSIMGSPYHRSVWEPYGRAYMRMPVYMPHCATYGLAISAPHGFFMGVPIWAKPYGILMCVPILASPYKYLTGPICACYLGPTWVHNGHPYGTLMCAIPYTSHTGPIWAGYLGPTCVHYGQPIWDCP